MYTKGHTIKSEGRPIDPKYKWETFGTPLKLPHVIINSANPNGLIG